MLSLGTFGSLLIYLSMYLDLNLKLLSR